MLPHGRAARAAARQGDEARRRDRAARTSSSTPPRRWIRNGLKPVQPLGREGFQAAGRPGLFGRGRQSLAAGESPSIAARPTATIPAARRSCNAVFEGLQVPFETGAARSSSAISPSPADPKEAAAMIRSLFVSMQELNKGARRPAALPPTRSTRSASSAPASWAPASPMSPRGPASRSCSSTATRRAPTRARRTRDASIADAIKKGRASPRTSEQLLARITPTRRLCGARRLRPRHRGGVRGSRREGRRRSRSAPRR